MKRLYIVTMTNGDEYGVPSVLSGGMNDGTVKHI